MAPGSQESYIANYEAFQPIWNALSPDVLRKVARENYIKIMDVARASVRAWEVAQEVAD